jgi:riboflavin-specific deaminase-like protein
LAAKALRLYPLPPEEIEPTGIYKHLPIIHLGEPAHASRPHVIVNMVASVDGRAAVGGKASLIGSDIDRRSMRNLRANSDAVMIGAGTLRAEKLSLGLDPSESVPPLAIIVTDTGNVPLEENLVVEGGQEVLLLLSAAVPQRAVERLRKVAQVMRAPADPMGAVDLDGALQILRAERGVESLVVEGGPGLNHALISRNLVDELFLTVAPELLGGTPAQTLTLLRGPEIPSRDRPALELVSIHLADDELFLRYSLTQTPSSFA